MKDLRFSLASLMAAVAFIAVGLAALRNPSAFVASTILTLTVSVLLCSTLAALVRHGTRRNFWIGFALFGWVYLFVVRSEPYGNSAYWTYLPTTELLSRFIRYGWQTNNDSGAYTVFQQGQIAHFLFTLVVAFVGGVLANWIGTRPQNVETESTQPPTC